MGEEPFLGSRLVGQGHGMSVMLTQLVWESAALVGTGLAGGVVIGFLLYPRLFRRGRHTSRAVNKARPAPRPYAYSVPPEQAPRQPHGQFLGRQRLY